METETGDIVLKGINNDKPFKIEVLNAEAAAIMAEAKEAAEGMTSKASRNLYITRRTVFAILLSSNSLMKQLKHEKDTPEYRDELEAIAKRMKADDLNTFIDKFQEVNKDFLLKAGMMKVAAAIQERAEDPAPTTSSQPPSTTKSNTPQG